jgi:hypothetical protein
VWNTLIKKLTQLIIQNIIHRYSLPMDNLDICLCICHFLSDGDALRLTLCNIQMNSLKARILFSGAYEYDKIKNLSFVGNFSTVKTKSYTLTTYPSHIKHIVMRGGHTSRFENYIFPESIESINMKHISWNSPMPKFPTTLKHLKLPKSISYVPSIYLKQELTLDTNVNLQSIGMNFRQCKLFNKCIPKQLEK